MLRSNSKSLGSHVVSPEEEKERQRWEGFAEKESFMHGMKEWVGDGKLIITRGKVLSWNSRPPASVILCWVSWVENVLFIMRQVICWFVYIGKKSPVYGVFGQ